MTSAIRTRRFGLCDEGGQAIVEFAFVMPFLVFLLLAICQFGLAFHNYLAITDAARVGARKAAVSRTAADTCQESKKAIQATVSTAQWNTIQSRVTCSPTTPGGVGTSYTVSIKYPVEIGLPPMLGLPAFKRSFDMNASATERLE
jgi:Flp pilus assembly protein TadG